MGLKARWALLLGCLTVFTRISSFAAGSVTLAWDASADVNVTGYRVYYGVASATYTNSAAVGNVTSATLASLSDGVTYYFAVTAYDATGTESDFSNEATYTVPAGSTNATPTLNAIAAVSISEDAAAQAVSLTGISSGSVSETQTLTVTASSSNPGLIPNPTVSYTSPNATGSLNFTPVANATGAATITVTVNDGQAANNTITRTFVVTVNAVNDTPTLAALSNVTINEDAAVQTVSLSGIATGAANESQTLTVTASSSNPGLIPNPTVSYTSPNATGSLSFTPVANASGTATITVTVNDGQAANNTVTRTFTVTVNAVNDVPTLNTLANVSVVENAGPQSVSLAGIGTGAANETQTLTVTATSSNPSLIPNPAVSYTSPNASGGLTFTPATDASGTATITVTVNDGQAANNTVTRTFTVTVSPVNNPPTLNALPDVTINEDSGAQSVSLSGIGTGAANETQTLTVTAASSNPGLIPNPTATYTSPSATGTLNFTPVANANGTATITVTVNDGQTTNNTVSRTFVVTVNAVNDAPTLAALSNVSVAGNAGSQNVSLSGIGTGATNETQSLAVTATSSNPSLIPNPTVTYTSPSATGSLSFAPAANLNGSATITVTVNDGQAANNTVTRTFTVTVVEANAQPTLTALSNVTISEDAGAQTVSLSGVGSGSVNETQTLTVTATSSNPNLIPNPAVTYTSPSATGSLSFTPAANANGTATISVTVNDGGSISNTVTRTFTVTVSPVNDAPLLNTLSDVTVNEDASAQTVSLSGISTGATNETQTLTITAVSSNPSLIPNPTVSYTSPSATGSLSFTPVANANGSATITVTVNDGQAANNTVTRTFNVTVNALNDAPTVNAIANVSIGENSGAQTVGLSGIGTGAANETQTLTVTAVSSNPTLIPNPTVSYVSPGASGSLAFTPAANSSGSATITVMVDDGQAANNTVVRTFTVAVNLANVPPTLTAIGNVSINEDAAAQTVSLAGIGSGSASESQTLTVTATSSNPSLIPNPTVSYTSPNTTGSLNFTPTAEANGTATISVTVNDGHAVSNTLTRTFTVTVNAVNDAPTLGAIADTTVNEDSGPQTVSLAGIATGAANETQTLTVTATSSNPSLIPNPAVAYTSPNAGGTLTFTPVTNGFGAAVITVTVNDGQAANNTVTRTFNVTVNPANDAPTLNAIANVSIGENATQQTVSLAGIGSGAANEAQTLTVTAVSSDPSLIPNPTVNYTSPGATGSLTFTPAANSSGSATVTVTVNDGQAANNTVVRTFTVNVNVANVPPTLAAINNVSISEEAAAQTVSLSGISSGSVNENQTLTVTATSSNPGLIPNPTVTYTSPSATGSLGFTPAADASGSAVITVTVNDGHAVSNTFSRTFTVTVAPVNDTPTLNAISSVTVDEDASAQSVSLSGISTGSTNETQTLTITAVSSNPGLIPNPTVSYTSPGATGSLNFTPVANANGSATITVTVNDGQAANNTVSRTFTVTVNPVNDTPTLGTIAGRTIAENAGLQTVSLSGIGTGAANETQSLGISATSSDTSLIPNPTVSYASPNTTGSLTFTPVTDANGTATITVTVNDGQSANSTTTRSFAVTVTAVNSAPTITAIPAQTIVSGGSSAPLSFTIADTETVAASLTLTAVSSAPSIIPLTNIVFSGTGSNRTVTVTSAPGVVGAANITLNVTDGAAAASTTFAVTVTEAPPVVGQLSMTKSGSGTVTPDLGTTTLIVGQTYSVTATPASGYLFSGWSGSVSSSSATISFTMQSNTVLQANFVANPYTTATATYNGLFNEADEVRLHSSGAFNLFMDGNGNFSAWVQIGYSRYQFAGAFGLNLRATNVVARWDGTPLTVELLIGSGATAGQISGRVTDGVWSAPLSGGRQVDTTPLVGEYTLVIPGTAGTAAQPAGDGYATMHVAEDGLATMSATLADGSKYSHSAYLTTDGDWPMYISLYVGKGSVMSWLTFTNLSTSDVSGNLVWTKMAGASPTSYPLGFTNGTKAVGSAYVTPLDIGKTLNLSGAVVSFSGGNLTAPFNNVVSVNAGNQVVNLSPNTLNFRITKNTGLFTGDVQDPNSGQTYTFGGVVLQKQNAGYGTMPGATLASRVVLAAP